MVDGGGSVVGARHARGEEKYDCYVESCEGGCLGGSSQRIAIVSCDSAAGA